MLDEEEYQFLKSNLSQITNRTVKVVRHQIEVPTTQICRPLIELHQAYKECYKYFKTRKGEYHMLSYKPQRGKKLHEVYKVPRNEIHRQEIPICRCQEIKQAYPQLCTEVVEGHVITSVNRVLALAQQEGSNLPSKILQEDTDTPWTASSRFAPQASIEHFQNDLMRFAERLNPWIEIAALRIPVRQYARGKIAHLVHKFNQRNIEIGHVHTCKINPKIAHLCALAMPGNVGKDTDTSLQCRYLYWKRLQGFNDANYQSLPTSFVGDNRAECSTNHNDSH